MAKNRLCLPSDKLPDCWKDEVRMSVLFAPVRNRSINSQDFDSKVSFWSNLIFNSCVHSQIYAFKLDDLKTLFNINGRAPASLPIVVEEMYKSGQIKPVAEYLQRPTESWTRWATDIFIKKPFVWSYTKVKNTLVSPNLSDHTFVNIAAVEANAEKLLTTLSDEHKNRVLNLQELLDITGTDALKVDDLKLVLHHLVCKSKADIKIVKSENTEEVPLQNFLIKFGDIKKTKPISDNDVSIHLLQQNEKVLSNAVEKLENEVETLISEAKSYLSKGQRLSAKSCLRRKHELETRITKRSNALQNIQVLLSRVQDTNLDTHVLDSYKTALSSIKQTFKDNSMSEDSVADTMTEIADVLDQHEDIQTTLAQSVIGNNDDEELEAELSELMANNGNTTNASPPPRPASPKKIVDDPETTALEKRLEILKLPLSTGQIAETSQL